MLEIVGKLITALARGGTGIKDGEVVSNNEGKVVKV